MLPTTIIIACLVGHFSSRVESYYLPFAHQGHQYEELEDQGYPYEAQYEFRASPPVPPPAPLFSPHFGFPEPPYPAAAPNPYNLLQQLPLPYQPFLRVPALIRPATPEIPLLIRLSDTRAILVPLKATYAFPGLIERLIQRIQTYYSVFNPVESLTVDRPLSPPPTTPQPPPQQDEITTTVGAVAATEESTEKDNEEKSTEATTAVEEHKDGEATEQTTPAEEGKEDEKQSEATTAPEESTQGPVEAETTAPAETATTAPVEDATTAPEEDAPTTQETTTDVAEERATTATSETSDQKPEAEN